MKRYTMYAMMQKIVLRQLGGEYVEYKDVKALEADVKELSSALKEILDIIDNASGGGIVGYHLNGNVLRWDDMEYEINKAHQALKKAKSYIRQTSEVKNEKV